MIIGLAVYFLYAKRHSNLEKPEVDLKVKQAGD